jgi:hypothetical protein
MHPIGKSCTHGLLTKIGFVQMINERLRNLDMHNKEPGWESAQRPTFDVPEGVVIGFQTFAGAHKYSGGQRGVFSKVA